MFQEKPLERKPTTDNPDFEPELKIEDVVLRITTHEATNSPDFNLIHTGYLRQGTRAYKVAAIYEVISRNTEEFKHYNLDIYSLQKLKRGWFFTYTTKFSLSGEHGEIEALYKFLNYVYEDKLPTQMGNYYSISKEDFTEFEVLKETNAGDLVQLVLENPDSYQKLVEVGGKELLESLVAIANQNNQGVELIKDVVETINDLEASERLEVLTLIRQQNLSKEDLNILSGRRDGLEEFSANLYEETNWVEADWQKFLEENPWIFGYGLDYRFLSILQREARVSSVTIGGEEQVIVDFLVGDSNFTSLVELKRPDTPLFSGAAKGKNRSGSWKLSEHLIFAVSQILEQKAEWLIKSQAKQYDKDRKLITQKTIDPKVILIIGHSEQFSGDDLDQEIKKQTFELFRRSQRNLEILTYDELYERAKFIVEE